jgi:hypothetical protein
MHTIEVQTKTCGLVRIHHNADWSGDVIVSWTTPDFEYAHHEITCPAALFLIVHAARNRASFTATRRALAERAGRCWHCGKLRNAHPAQGRESWAAHLECCPQPETRERK